ncbi:MAG TPA: ribosome small subunit-dependent GTPase A [Tepidisphaeraceae bacterium]|jgi:ribosome biogenesis GTPase|nr:ribosome small subunit-dependent GTPase A [Tepidisphaeraceae bacterium]
MPGKRKSAREKDLTSRYLDGELDEDRMVHQQRFSDRSKHHQHNKTIKTGLLRAAEEEAQVDLATLPVGHVIQVYSLFCDVMHEGTTYLCVVRKQLIQTTSASVIVGDEVKFRATGVTDESGRPEAVIEEILARRTLLTRADSFKARESHPIVANAEQMLIVASVAKPTVKWGLIDRMLIAAEAGGLVPIVCLNKLDLRETEPEEFEFATAALAQYATLQIRTIQTSVEQKLGLDELRELLRGRTTVLAGHSGVGKSSLIRSIQPSLDIRVGAVSGFNDKGRHTTSSAKRYPLDFGGAVIDTPGVKLFGLWNVTRENLLGFFPDVEADAAPKWRMESYARIESSLTE